MPYLIKAVLYRAKKFAYEIYEVEMCMGMENAGFLSLSWP